MVGDLTCETSDAIVNPAGAGMVDSAIRRAAGPELLDAFHQAALDLPTGKLSAGHAISTPGFDSAARRVIHVDPPVYADDAVAAAREPGVGPRRGAPAGARAGTHLHLVSGDRHRHPSISPGAGSQDCRRDRAVRASRAPRPADGAVRALHAGDARALRRRRARALRGGSGAERARSHLFRRSPRVAQATRRGNPSGSRRRYSRDRRPGGSAAPRTGCRRPPERRMPRRPRRHAASPPGAPVAVLSWTAPAGWNG